MPSQDLLVRPTTEADADAFREMRLEALRNHPEAYSADYDEQANFSREQWLERLRNGNTFVACEGDTLVGMAGIFRDGTPKTQHKGKIWGVYVRPNFRGHGLAQRLVNTCVDWARAQQLRYVMLAVITTNTSAVNAYKKCGFAIYGVEPDGLFWDNVYYDEFVMIKWL
jgi:RimJ/RimL family protein N-acetyltransferase